MGRDLALVGVRRSCGDADDRCTLCCKVLAIPEVPSEKDAWCCHAGKHRGCAIYPGRPSSCQTFECLWMQGHLPPWARPDKIHGVVTASDNNLQIHEDPGWPGDASQRLKPLLEQVYRAGRYVLITCGTSWRLLGTPEALNRVREVRAE